MDKLKKIEKRLEKLYRVQKQLEKKKKKMVKLAAQNKKKVAANSKKMAAAKAPVKIATKAGAKKNKALKLVAVSLGLTVLSTVVAVVVTKLIQRANIQKKAGIRSAAEDGNEYPSVASNADYEKASLEELEEALLKVENQLEEVTAAIENSKK